MCLKCDAPNDRYFVQDAETGWYLCEECGFAVETFTQAGYSNGIYIWEINAHWPVFASFQELIRKVVRESEVLLPACRLVQEIPSRLLTFLFELLAADETDENKSQEPLQ